MNNLFCKFDGIQITDKQFFATVVETQKKYVFVAKTDRNIIDSRDVWLASIPKKFYQNQDCTAVVCVGDLVICEPTTDSQSTAELPTCQIIKCNERLNLISRPINNLVQNIAANVDGILLIQSISNPNIDFEFLDRYLALSEEIKCQACLVFNKADLIPKLTAKKRKLLDESIKYYNKIGYKVLLLTALDKYECQQLFDILNDKIHLVVGKSGVGKSSLLNGLDPELFQAIDENENLIKEGRHTTSFVSMIKINQSIKNSKSYLIDTPGIKYLSLVGHNSLSLMGLFPELRDFIGKCEFRDCSHLSEQNCKVKDAVASGDILLSRYKSFLSILKDS